jgi:indolepyruvate ferredoxin oxidoreductase alpha subunit
VLVVADDPGMHSSQNEQDSRYYAEFAKIPAFEPSTQQQAYNMMWEAFELSEQVKLPVMLRLVTRLAHSRADVQAHHRGQYTPEDTAYSRPNPNDWTLVPGNARVRFRHLLALQPQLREISEQSTHNQLKLGSKKGIIASGIAYNYTKEALPTDSDMSLLRIGMYPLPVNLLKQLVDHCDEIFVMEDGYPYIEERLNGLFGLPGKQVHGKLSGSLPPSGELTPRLVATALNSDKGQVSAALSDLAPRPPQLCKGCPHIDTFNAMVKASADQGGATMFSDIGCYTLGVMPPFRAVHSCVDMGASIAMAHGASLAGAHPIICTIGDSTFAHSGMTGLIGAIKSNANMTVMILDNATVAMTGSQETMATGEQLMALLRGLGVPEEHLHLMDPHPKKHEENIELIAKAIQHRGLDVIVSRRPCIQIKRQKPK